MFNVRNDQEEQRVQSLCFSLFYKPANKKFTTQIYDSFDKRPIRKIHDSYVTSFIKER